MSARLTAEDHRLRAITEAAWQAQVLDIARLNGWETYHPPRAGVRALGSVRDVPAGWPDLALVRGPRLVFVELKRQTGKTTPAQNRWLTLLARTSNEVYVFRPSDLPEVVRVLSRPS